MRILFLGDIMVTEEQLAVYKEQGQYCFFDAVNCIEEFKDSNYIVANLETPIAGQELQYTNELYSFNTPTELAKHLKQCGVDMVTTANNHCLDRGIEGLKKTIDYLESCGLAHIGTHGKEEDSYYIKEINGIKVGFMSFTYGTNAFANHNYLNSSQKFMVDMLQSQELSNPFTRKLWTSNRFFVRVIRKLQRIFGMGQWGVQVYERRESSKKEMAYYKKTIEDCKKAGAEYLVSCLHIGGQYNENPTNYTKEICKLSLDLGVNAVIANHEHVIHGVDKEHLTESTFCIYSLGNFLSSTGVTSEPFDKMAQYSVAVVIDLSKNASMKVKAEYSFILFCSVCDVNGKVYSVPLFDYVNTCKEVAVKERLLIDNNALVNRVYNTQNVKYPFLKEYQLSI